MKSGRCRAKLSTHVGRTCVDRRRILKLVVGCWQPAGAESCEWGTVSFSAGAFAVAQAWLQVHNTASGVGLQRMIRAIRLRRE